MGAEQRCTASACQRLWVLHSVTHPFTLFYKLFRFFRVFYFKSFTRCKILEPNWKSNTLQYAESLNCSGALFIAYVLNKRIQFAPNFYNRGVNCKRHSSALMFAFCGSQRDQRGYWMQYRGCCIILCILLDTEFCNRII